MGSLLGEAGLGGLGFAGAAPREARRASAAFLRGSKTKASCGVAKKGGARPCVFESDGQRLIARGTIVARRAAPNTDTIEVCVPKGSPAEVRQAANAVLRGLKAGVGVRTVKGASMLSGRKGRAKAELPGACIQVRVSKKMRETAARAISAEMAARFPAPAKVAAKGGKKEEAKGLAPTLGAGRKGKRR